jgi:biopolymer transport protein ExbB/TolQ
MCLPESGMGGESSKQMAGNIGSALWTTAAGLVVAIPTLIAYFFIQNQVRYHCGSRQSSCR